MFKKTDSHGDSAAKKELLNGGPVDLDMANELCLSERWVEALDVLDNILGLPEDREAALSRLVSLLQDTATVVLDMDSTGRAADGRHVSYGRKRLSGGLVPDLLAMRGQCIWQAMLGVMERHDDDFRAIVADPAFESLCVMGTMHVQLTTRVCTDHSEAMFYAGMVCLSCQQPTPAAKILQHVLQLNPQHKGAAAALPMAVNAARARGDMT